MMRVGCWDTNQPSGLHLTRIVVDGYTTCGPDDPSCDMVESFVNPVTRSICHLAVPVPYERFAAAWPSLEAWLLAGWRSHHADPTTMVWTPEMTGD